MDISEVAKRSGVPASALRYYERKGLITSLAREGARRKFSPAVLDQLALVALGQAAGFSLDEIRAMFTPDGEPSIDRAMLSAKADELAGMLAFLMNRLGLKPNFIGGGRVKQFKTKTHPGNSFAGDGNILVIEACESDGTITRYKPEHLILLNLQFDHNTIDLTADMFTAIMNNTEGMVLSNADDKNLNLISPKTAISFSTEAPSKYRATDISLKPFSTGFSLNNIRFTLSLPGKYNLYNALSCIAILSETGIPLNTTSGILHEFQGIERRFDIHLNNEKYLVIDD